MRVRLVHDGVILLFLIFLLVVSIDYPVRTKLVPWIFICLAIIFLIWQILKDISTGAQGDERAKSDLTLTAWIKLLKAADWAYLKVMLWIGALFIAVYLLGFTISAPLFNILFLKHYGETWRFSVGFSVIVWGSLFILFGLVLHIPIYKGMLFSLVSL